MRVFSNTYSFPTNEKIEYLLRKILPLYLLFVFISTVLCDYKHYRSHNPWTMGDWLINYQGGMIRRGLLGEAFIRVSNLTHLNPGIFVISFQLFCYATFFIFSYLNIRRQPHLSRFALLIFSPFIFTFQLNDPEGGFRKEIIYFAALALIIYLARTQKKHFHYIFYAFLLLYPIIILCHEMLAIFLPYFIIVFISTSYLTKKRMILLGLFLLPSVISFIICCHFSGTSRQTNKIFESLNRAGYAVSGGIIKVLDKPAEYGESMVVDHINKNGYSYYLIITAISLIAFIPIRKTMKDILLEKLIFSLMLTSILGTSLLFVVATDWGRFIYIHLVSLFLISLVNKTEIIKRQEVLNEKEANKFKPAYQMSLVPAILILISYSLIWHIPHCCYPEAFYAKNFKDTNIVSYLRPYKRAIDKLISL